MRREEEQEGACSQPDVSVLHIRAEIDDGEDLGGVSKKSLLQGNRI